jgi:hypothetical protein
VQFLTFGLPNGSQGAEFAGIWATQDAENTLHVRHGFSRAVQSYIYEGFRACVRTLRHSGSLESPRPGGPTAKLQPSPAGLGNNPDMF